jgi:hypothetical protein
MKRPSTLLSVLLLAATTARAEAPAAEDNTAKARALFQNGLALAQQGELAAALREFEAAYAARPHYSVLYNIAQARAALGRPVEAIAAFQSYLADGGKHISEARREEVEALIATNRRRIGQLRISGGNAATRVWLDGRELSESARGQAISLAQGEHSLVFWDGSAPPESRTLLLQAEDAVEVSMPEQATIPPPQQTFAHLAISCGVPDVDVDVVGIGQIKTPQTQPWVVPTGDLSVRFSRPGYPARTLSVRATEGSVAQLDCNERPLSPVPPQLAARLNLVLKPADADVFVDGQPYLGGALPAGQHQLSVEHDGFVSVARRISVEAGKTRLLQISLTQTRHERERLRREQTQSHTAALVLGGLALGALGASAGVYAWNSGRYDDFQAKRASGKASPDDAARIQRGDDAALSLLVVGGVLGVSGAWLYFSAP